MRRLAAVLAALVLSALPAAAASPAPAAPPAGTVLVQVLVWDGMAALPAGQVLVAPIACAP